MLTKTQERIRDNPEVSEGNVSRSGNQQITNKGKQAIAGESSMVTKLPTMYSFAHDESSFLAWFCSSADRRREE